MKKFLFLHIAIFSLLIPSISQSVSETLAHAKALYLQGEFNDAITDLRRVLFFKNNADPEACIMLGDCYRNLRQADKSLYYYELAYDLFNSDSMKLETRFNIISLYLIVDEPNYSLTQIFSLPEKLNSKDELRINFYSALAYYQLNEYTLSKEYFIKALKSDNIALNYKIDSIFTLAEKNNNFNVYLPMFLSIVPGLGQLYLGEYEAALNSFILTSAFAGIYVFSLANLTMLDAILTVAPWFHRYYQGGLLQAKDLAVKLKAIKDIEYYNALIVVYEQKRNLN